MDKKRINMEEYYNSLHNMPLTDFTKHLDYKTKCRVCLQDGDMPITSVRHPNDMKEALNVFGNIQVNDSEKNRTCLCYVCYKFLKSAILFRKVALRSNETLNKPLFKQSPNYLDDYDYLDDLNILDPYEDEALNLFNSNIDGKEVKRNVKHKKLRSRRLSSNLDDYNYIDTLKTFEDDKSNLHILDKEAKVEEFVLEEKKSILKTKSPKRHDYVYFETIEDKSHVLHSNKNVNKVSEVKKKESTPKRLRKIPKVQCKICKKVLGKQYYYNIHLKLHNPNLPDEFVCDICGKSFKLKKVYLGHMERHETRYIYKCHLCPFAGRYKERLSMHMRVHTGDLKYLCTQCPARYISRGRLNDHVRLKHTEPQFKCDSCEKAYHNSLTLQRHIEAAHLKIKKHQCDQCGQAFGYRHDMLKHQRIVHKRASLRPRFSKSAYKRISNKADCISDDPTA